MFTNFDINEFLFALFPDFFLGCYPIDNLQSIKSHPKKYFAVVINTSPSTIGIGHFVCIIKLNECLVYIDPLGFPPLFPKIKLYLQSIEKNDNFFINTKQLQPDSSQWCGLYVCCFISYFYKWKNNPSIFKMTFSNNLLENDQLCREYLYKLLQI